MKLKNKIANLFGYDLIKSKKSPTLISHISQLIRIHKIDLILDVGANDGQFARLLRESGYAGQIFSFEPVNDTFSKLFDASKNDELWEVFQFGLGDKCENLEINVSKASDLSSILNASTFGTNEYPNIEVGYKELIKIQTLDNFFIENNLAGKNIFLKMDTQGYDLKVFQGAKNSLIDIKVILSEISFIPIYEGMPHWVDVMSLYESFNFGVSGFYPVSRNKKNLSLIEADCVLVKNI